jgi:probable HAF family extracellular repeat protein
MAFGWECGVFRYGRNLAVAAALIAIPEPVLAQDFQGLGFLPGGNYSQAQGVSADGSVVVGNSTYGNGSNPEAFRWTSGGMIGLGFLPGGTSSIASAANANGSVVVGWSTNASGIMEAIRWTQFYGMQSIQQLLTNAGVNMTGWNLSNAYGVNADGSVIVGIGTDPAGMTEAWIERNLAFITPSIAAQSFASLLGFAESGHAIVNSGLDTLGEIGAHHNCTATCLDVYALSSFEKGSTFDDPGYVGTVGIAQALAPNFSVGATFSDGYYDDKLANGSRESQRTAGGGLHAAYVPDQGINVIVAGLYTGFSAGIDRGYLNGNTPVTSHGATDGYGYGGLARLGYAFRVSPAVRLMPFGEFELTRIHYDGWTETTGPFPAMFSAINDTQSRSRLGLEARYALTDTTYLWATGDWAHRFNATTVGIQGELVGLFGLTLPGSPVNRDWAEVTAGVKVALTTTINLSVSLSALFDNQNSTITAARVGLSAKF